MRGKLSWSGRCGARCNRLIIEKILGADGAVWLSFETLWAKMKDEGKTFNQTQAQIDREANKLVASAEALQVTDLGKCKIS